jgi:hypothetical protein
MSRTTTTKTPFAVSRDGEHFIDAECSGIHPLVIQIDGLPLIYFGDEQTAYMRVQDVIDWHRKEIKESAGLTGNPRIIRYLTTAMEKLQAGKVDWE